MITNNLRLTVWHEPEACTISAACLAACDGDSFLATILWRRGFTDPQRIGAFLFANRYAPSPPEQLPDLVTGSALLRNAIRAEKRILIWGDFDVDGETSTALLLDGLQRLGANVAYFIPNRLADSHGIKLASLQAQIAEKRPDLLVTCDTGISEFEALDYTHSIGLPVIVTDHHELADHLPVAAAVITPRRLPLAHPLTSLPGVGVAYKLTQHLFTELGREAELPHLLDLVALGIVGDVATQTDDTRYLLQLGLEHLRHTQRLGLTALLEAANLNPAGLTDERIAYQIAPRLNAAGRLADAALSVELLTTRNSARARILAQQLEGLNHERRLQTRQIENAAEEMITAKPALLDSAALVLYQPEWNPGITGIVASHLAERYARPVVMLSGQEEGIARGSARSPGGFDINQALNDQTDILRTFGGHPRAAGLSLEIRHIERFRQRFSQTLIEQGIRPERQIAIDAEVSFDQLTLDLVGRLQRLAPFGEGNRPVVLSTSALHLAHSAVVGRDQLHRRLTVEDRQGRQQIVMWWHSVSEAPPEGLFDVAYNVSINERQEAQLSLVDFRPNAEAVIEVKPVPINVVDWRNDPDPLSRLGAILTEYPEALVWAEGFPRQGYPAFKRRAELTQSDSLILFGAPPDPQTLSEALEKVQPRTVYIFGVQPLIDSQAAFLVQLAQAAHNVIEHHDGETQLNVLCGATGQSMLTVRAGLEYLVANGQIANLTWPTKTKARFGNGNATATLNTDLARARLVAAYEETVAYRRYFASAPLDRLLAQ